MVPKICTFEDCNKPHSGLGLCNAHRMQFRTTGILKPLQRWDRSLPEEPRFWQKVDRREPQECWEWQAAINRHGYGFLNKGGSPAQAHRVAFEYVKGEIPAGAEIDHICHNTKCVNPDHLRLATPKQNRENHSGPQSNSTTGFRGVYWHKGNKSWAAAVTSAGKTTFCGYFSSREEAAEAARLKRLELFTYNDIDRGQA
jgi:hypothetical protein